MTPAYRRALELHPAVPHETSDAMNRTPEANARFRAANQIRASLTQDDWAEKVRAFRTLYRLPLPESIAPLSAADVQFHMGLLREEFDETEEALLSDDVVETVDGFLDIIYVSLGALLHLGLSPAQIRDGMQEVHASNMTKVDSNGQPVYSLSGKVQKGANYVKATLEPVLDRGVKEPS